MDSLPSVLVVGMDELASACARHLLLAGCPTALQSSVPPPCLRRGMAYANAWHGDMVELEGLPARRADSGTHFLKGLRDRTFLPVLTQDLDHLAGRWPWDVVVASHPMPGMDLGQLGERVIGLGPGFTAGRDVDTIIALGGRDPGEVLEQGQAADSDATFADGIPVEAALDGLFFAAAAIGESVAAGIVLGWIGSQPIHAPAGGILRGLARDGTALRRGDALAELVAGSAIRTHGIAEPHRIIARALALHVQVEFQGAPRLPFS